MKKMRPTLIALTATLTLAVSACGSDDGASAPVDSGSSTATSSTSTSSSTSASSSTSTSTPTSSDATDDATKDAAGADLGTIREAITAAEKKGGGTAYEIDDQDDDGSWEVDVAKASTSIEVTVDQDGRATTDDDRDDLDDDDRAALKAAKITVGDAIEAALDEVDGTFDDVELEEDGGSYHWQVSVDTDTQDDTEVRVDVVTGKATVDTDDASGDDGDDG